MKVFTFKRGIHPPEHKAETENCAIEVIMPQTGELMVYPLVQHIGTPCAAIVKIGDRVLVGQKIADSSSAMSSPIHASISGTVKECKKTITPTGIMADAIVIENDGLMEEIPSMAGTKEFLRLSKMEYLAKIREAGIVGLGGAGFPTHIKLNPPEHKKIEYVIVNASECEPYLTTDFRVMLEQPENIKRGLQIVLAMFPDAKGIIGIETNKMRAIEVMTKICSDDNRISIMPLLPKYPQGSEKQLIEACTGRQVPTGKLPADIGCIVDNVDTIIAIDRCIYRGRPLMRKVITLAGEGFNKPGNYKVRLGMSYKNMIEAAGGLKGEPAKMISGGPMMGVAMFDLDVPVIKTSSAILAFTDKEAGLPKEQSCIRCGRCMEHCPVNLMPLELNQYALRGEIDLFKKHHGLDCIECGTCSYVCPAKRHLAQSIRAIKRRPAIPIKK